MLFVQLEPLNHVAWEVHSKTAAVGVDVILSLDLDLGPEDFGSFSTCFGVLPGNHSVRMFSPWSQERAVDATSDMDAACVVRILGSKVDGRQKPMRGFSG